MCVCVCVRERVCEFVVVLEELREESSEEMCKRYNDVRVGSY